MPPGSRMPSQRELAERYGVAAETLRKALDVLSREGVVSAGSTRGTFIMKVPGTPEPSNEYRQLSDQLDVLTEEMRQLASRVDNAEVQPSEIAGLREAVATLKAQVINLYHSVGQPYPYEESAPTEGRKAV